MPKQIRIECTAEGLTGNWVEMSPVWTRGEMRRWYTAVLSLEDAEYFELLRTKITGVHVYLPDGDLVADVDALIERFDDMDERLVRWLAAGLSNGIKELLALGEGSRRLLFDGVEVLPKTRTPTPTT